MDPLENILENFSSSNLQDQFICYENFNSIIKNKEFKMSLYQWRSLFKKF